MGFLALCGILIQRSAFLPTDHIPTAGKDILLASHESVPWGAECFRATGDESQYGGLCRIGDINAAQKPQFVVWGDSHADALVPLFELLGITNGVQGVVFDDASCAPIEGVHQVPAAPDCEKENASALAYIRDNDIRRVILVARWSYYVMGGQNGRAAAFITDSNSASTNPAEAEAAFERTFIPMVLQLVREGREVYIVEQVPEQFYFNERDVFYHAVHTGDALLFQGISAKESEAYQALPNATINSLAKYRGVHVIDPAALLCKSSGLCELAQKGVFLYRDEDHLSTAGAMSLEPLFTRLFESMHPSNK